MPKQLSLISDEDKKYTQERFNVIADLVKRYGEENEKGFFSLDFYGESVQTQSSGEWKEIYGVLLNPETNTIDFKSDFDGSTRNLATRVGKMSDSEYGREMYMRWRKSKASFNEDFYEGYSIGLRAFLANDSDPKYTIEKILLAAVNSTISNGKNCQAGPCYERERDETVALIKKYCSHVIDNKHSSQKSDIRKWENAWKECSGSNNPRDSIFDKICESITDRIKNEYGGRLDLPETIPLNGSDRAMAATNWSWMAAFNSIDDHGNVCINGESDVLNATCGGYGIDFLIKLNNLVGGSRFEMEEGIIKRDIDMDIDWDGLENCTIDVSPEKLFDKFFEAQSKNGEMPYTGLLRGMSGYVCNKIGRKEDGGYYAEYHIYPPSGMHDPKLHEPLSMSDLDKMFGGCAVVAAINYHKKFANSGSTAFNEAFFDLMPHLYEQMVIKDGIIPENLHEVLEYADTKNKIQTKLSELKGKTPTDNVLDDSKTKIQVLREVAKGNVSEEKGVTNRKRDDNSITKQTTKAMLGEKSTQR